MRILFLTPDLPVPPDQGAKLRNLALIHAAAAHHEVDVLSFASQAAPPSFNALCRRVVTVEPPARHSLLQRGWALWLDPTPDLAHRLESSAYHEALRDLLEHERYDVVQIEGLEMMPYLGEVRGGAPRTAVIYDAHNAEMTLQRTIWQTELRDPRRWHGALYSFFQWSKLGTYERVMMNATNMVLAVSEPDAARLKGRHVDPVIVPNGVDTAAIAFRGGVGPLPPAPSPNAGRGGAASGPGGAGRSPQLLFVGPLDYRPNADAVRWLLGGILPAVRARRPDVRLRLVGRGTERLHGEGVETLGYVDDMSDELAHADALVVPMRMGGGVRFKVLEAMAAGVPVISTPMGLAGVAAVDEQHALVARSSAEFATAVVRILDDPALVQRLATAARRLVEARYDWSKITPAYLRLLSATRRRVRAGR